MACARPSPLWITAFLWLTNVLVITACQVPVFRYALERWEPATYLVSIVPASGGLTDAEQKWVEHIRAAPQDAADPVNLEIQVESPTPAAHHQARIALHYPHKLRDAGDQPIWQAPLTEENVRLLLDSPVRQNLRQRLLAGQSAVWLFVESGNPAKDDAAAKALTQALEKAQASVKLPDGVVTSEEAAKPSATKSGDPSDALQSNLPLRIEFSVLRVPRNDPKEAAFIAMLTHVEPDLKDFAGEPMAFPVFGRGRVLEPLIGAGIHDENVMKHSAYLCGACSCEVKDQNPGIDLLMAANWNPVDTTPKLEVIHITPQKESPPTRSLPLIPLAIGVVLLGLGAWRLCR